MITLKVIALVWTILMSTYALVAKINGTGTLGTLIIKLLSLVTLIYSGYELLQMLP